MARSVLANPVEEQQTRKRRKTTKKRQSTRRTKTAPKTVETQPVAKTAAPLPSLDVLRPAFAAARDAAMTGAGEMTFDEFNDYWRLATLVQTAERQAATV